MDHGALVASAQLRTFESWQRRGPSLLQGLTAARTPEELAALVDHAQGRLVEAALGREDQGVPATLRRQYAAELRLAGEDLAFRDLYPGLDVGIYACSHSMGVPSVGGPAAVLDQLGELARSGIGVWDDGTWPAVMDLYRARVAELVGGDLESGDVAWFPNVSEALSAVLEGFPSGTLVYTRGHFTTGHYVHHQWAQNTGGRLREVPTDEDGKVPTERVVEALDRDVRVVSLSHALFESGWLQDLPTIAREVRARCPDALLLVDAYQTAGTVPIDVRALGDHVAVTAGGHKQLRSATGAGFLYVPRRWLPGLTPRRTGWWGHAAPFAFEKGPVRRADDASRLRSGTPTLTGMAMLLGELAALATSADGSLPGAVRRARAHTSALVARLLARGRAAGLHPRGDFEADRRAAFVVFQVPDGVRLTEHLARGGVRVDVRPVRPGSADGYVRVGANSAAFPYEIDAVVEAIARHRPPPS